MSGDGLFPNTESALEVRRPKERAYEWPLAAALIWIVWRDIGRANSAWAACSETGELTWSETDLTAAACQPPEAAGLLLEGLRSGEIRSYGRRSEDPEPTVILPHHWTVLLLENGIPQAPDGFYSVLLQAADVRRLSTGSAGPVATFTPIGKDPSVKKMGRPGKYEWAAAAGFMAGYIVEYAPERRDIVAVLSKWFLGRSKEPDQSELDKFVTEALKAMRN